MTSFSIPALLAVVAPPEQAQRSSIAIPSDAKSKDRGRIEPWRLSAIGGSEPTHFCVSFITSVFIACFCVDAERKKYRTWSDLHAANAHRLLSNGENFGRKGRLHKEEIVYISSSNRIITRAYDSVTHKVCLLHDTGKTLLF